MMTGLLVAAIILGLIGLILVLIATRWRRARGLTSGKTVALDNVLLASEGLKLVGRPDRLVLFSDTIIIEEWKPTAKRVSPDHRLQLGAYFILVEQEFWVRPPFGVVVLAGGKRVEVENTEALRSEVLGIAQEIREHRAKLGEAIPVRQPAAKCRVCGQRGNCGQARCVVCQPKLHIR